MLILFIANLVALATAVSAAVLAYNGVGGWGWFLFVSVLTVHSFEARDEEKGPKGGVEKPEKTP